MIFKEHPQWRLATLRAKKRWGTPQSLQLAFIYTESRFKATARPGYDKTLGMSLFHKSSALGYAQALDNTWRHYLASTKQMAADRENFSDATDFIGWYTNQTRRRLSIPYSNVSAHYMAYHEGWGGYVHHSYYRKRKLIRLSRRVASLDRRYKRQILLCKY